MTIVIDEITARQLPEYARIPASYDATERVAMETLCAGRETRFATHPLPGVFRKDYDAPPGASPAAWPSTFDLSTWGLLLARRDGEAIGGAAVAWGSAALAIPAGAPDTAVLWDIRVAPTGRGLGIGSELFLAASRWARARGATVLQAETQDVNPAACRFYAWHGCTLALVEREAYPELPGEARLLWHLTLV